MQKILEQVALPSDRDDQEDFQCFRRQLQNLF